MANKIALTIIVSVILTVIVISLVNVGISIILNEPEYEDYCDVGPIKIAPNNMTDEEREEFNEGSEKCHKEYRDAQKPYNQYKYYIGAGAGLYHLSGLFKEDHRYLHCNTSIDGTKVIFRERKRGKENILELTHPDGTYEKMRDSNNDLIIDSYKIENPKRAISDLESGFQTGPKRSWKRKEEYWGDVPGDKKNLKKGQVKFDKWIIKIKKQKL